MISKIKGNIFFAIHPRGGGNRIMNPHSFRHCENRVAIRGNLQSLRHCEGFARSNPNIQIQNGLLRSFHSLAMTSLPLFRHCENLRQQIRGNLLSLNGLLRQLRFLAMTIFISINLNATELSSITGCASGQRDCKINSNYENITNSGRYITGTDIRIESNVNTFINYGSMVIGDGNQAIAFETNGYIGHFINYGDIGFHSTRNIQMSFWITNGFGVGTITNYGLMSTILHENRNGTVTPLTLNNLGLMSFGWGNNPNLQTQNNGRILIQNYTLMINETATQFLAFSGHKANEYLTSFSHLVLDVQGNSSITFKDKNSRILLDFGADFELGAEYSISKVATDTNGNTYTALGVDFSRLSTRNDIYTLSQSGDNFVVSMNPQYGTMGTLYKSNIKTMNNFYLQSNNMIYPHKYKRKKFGNTNPNTNPRNNNYRRVRGISNLFMNPHNIYANNDFVDSLDSHNSSYLQSESLYSSLQDSTPTRHSELSLESEESTNLNKGLDSNLDSFALDSSLRALHYAQNDGESANLPIQSNELFFYDNEWLLARDNANARKVNMDYTHSVKAVNNSNVSKDAYYNKRAYRNKIITNDTRTNEINQYQSTNRVGNVSRAPNQNNRHLANQSNNSPCGSYKCIYIYKPQQQTKQIQPQPKEQPKPQPKIEPKVVEQPKIEPKIQPQPKPIQAIRPTMPPPPKVEPKIEPKPIVQPKEQPKVMPNAEPKVVKVESKPTPPKPKVIIQDPYYFILTPYVAHNFFYEAGRYNLSGLEYGFITAFSGKITEEHILGLHFAFSYGSLKDSVDSIFNITSMNIMGGLNYKFDITNDMYLKARVDIFYFLNQVQSTMTSGNIMKPNNLGFGASVAYGKEWDFDKNGILGLEVALDYKGLMSPNILTQNGGDSTINESFNKALYNMLYVDLGVNYDKYFETNIGKWGLDTGLGVKVNATANALAKSSIRLNNIRDIDMVLDNDMFLAYLNIGGSYLLESKDFDMEFSLAYYGNFGDRSMSNGGGFEWRVYW